MYLSYMSFGVGKNYRFYHSIAIYESMGIHNHEHYLRSTHFQFSTQLLSLTARVISRFRTGVARTYIGDRDIRESGRASFSASGCRRRQYTFSVVIHSNVKSTFYRSNISGIAQKRNMLFFVSQTICNGRLNALRDPL